MSFDPITSRGIHRRLVYAGKATPVVRAAPRREVLTWVRETQAGGNIKFVARLRHFQLHPTNGWQRTDPT